MFFILFLLIMSIIFYLLFYSNFFSIKNIEIKGNENISKEKILNYVNDEINKNILFVIKKNLLLLSSQSLERQLLQFFTLDAVDVQKKFPHSVEIIIQEKKPIFILVIKDKGYFVDENGNIFSEITQKDIEIKTSDNYNILRHNFIYKNLTIIYDTKNNQLTENIKKLIKNYNPHIKNIITSLHNKITNINISFYEIIYNEFSIYAQTSEGWKIYFSLLDDIDEQIDTLNLILQNKPRVGKILNYIDLRYGNKVFYK